MTPADELRTAATKLRKLTDDATPGPWWGDDIDEVQSPDGQVARVKASPHPTSRFIAAMHPGVGAALADWLDVAVAAADETRRHHPERSEEWIASLAPQALAVARQINGTQQ